MDVLFVELYSVNDVGLFFFGLLKMNTILKLKKMLCKSHFFLVKPNILYSRRLGDGMSVYENRTLPMCIGVSPGLRGLFGNQLLL